MKVNFFVDITIKLYQNEAQVKGYHENEMAELLVKMPQSEGFEPSLA